MSKIEVREDIELVLRLHEILKKKNTDNSLLKLIEFNEGNMFTLTKEFHEKYFKDFDYDSAQGNVRYALDLLKEIYDEAKQNTSIDLTQNPESSKELAIPKVNFIRGEYPDELMREMEFLT